MRNGRPAHTKKRSESIMTYAVFEDEHYYICHDGRKLRHIRIENKQQDGYTQTFEVYGCRTAAAVNIKPDAFTNTMRRES